jgi:hypothetical protein
MCENERERIWSCLKALRIVVFSVHSLLHYSKAGNRLNKQVLFHLISFDSVKTTTLHFLADRQPPSALSFLSLSAVF